MTEYCINHPMTEALSICHNCGKHFCAECLSEGKEYYYCKAPECQFALNKELNPDSIPGEVICPECKAVVRLNSEEMSKHLFRCPECESLINILVNGPEIINDPDFVELFSTRSQPDISLIHSILDDSGLDFYITGENLLSLWTGIAKVFVASGQVNQAKELLKDFEIHLFGLSNKETEDAE